MLGIDPWNYADSEILVGDEVYWRLKGHAEFGMGSPLLGGLEFIDKQRRLRVSFEKRYFGGPPCWDEEKKLFIIPEWKTLSFNKFLVEFLKIGKRFWRLILQISKCGPSKRDSFFPTF